MPSSTGSSRQRQRRPGGERTSPDVSGLALRVRIDLHTVFTASARGRHTPVPELVAKAGSREFRGLDAFGSGGRHGMIAATGCRAGIGAAYAPCRGLVRRGPPRRWWLGRVSRSRQPWMAPSQGDTILVKGQVQRRRRGDLRPGRPHPCPCSGTGPARATAATATSARPAHRRDSATTTDLSRADWCRFLRHLPDTGLAFAPVARRSSS